MGNPTNARTRGTRGLGRRLSCDSADRPGPSGLLYCGRSSCGRRRRLLLPSSPRCRQPRPAAPPREVKALRLPRAATSRPCASADGRRGDGLAKTPALRGTPRGVPALPLSPKPASSLPRAGGGGGVRPVPGSAAASGGARRGCPPQSRQRCYAPLPRLSPPPPPHSLDRGAGGFYPAGGTVGNKKTQGCAAPGGRGLACSRSPAEPPCPARAPSRGGGAR